MLALLRRHPAGPREAARARVGDQLPAASADRRRRGLVDRPLADRRASLAEQRGRHVVAVLASVARQRCVQDAGEGRHQVREAQSPVGHRVV